MGKLMRVIRGRAFVVAVDVRKNSPTLGQWVGIEACGENALLVWAPAGFARGFCVLSDYAEIEYQCTGVYNSAAEASIRWDDPTINIRWPIADPVVSDRDRRAHLLSDWLATKESDLVRIQGAV
jgi:dTDP-4-dehydrorhamnose 3,5-epimerase